MLGRTLDEKVSVISPEDYWKHEINWENYKDEAIWWYLELFDQEDSAYYWDDISWPSRYCSQLDHSHYGSSWAYRRADEYGQYPYYLLPKHAALWRKGRGMKHRKGESRRRQHYKNKAKSHVRMATRDAFRGSPKQLMSGRIATAWDIN